MIRHFPISERVVLQKLGYSDEIVGQDSEAEDGLDLCQSTNLHLSDADRRLERHVSVGVAIKKCECLDENGNGGVKLRARSVQQLPLFSRLDM